MRRTSRDTRDLLIRATRLAALIVAVTIGACGESVVAPVPKTAIVGQWMRIRPAGEPPGFFTNFNLTLNGGSITGTGTWSGEAGPSGTVSVTGTVADTVHLDLTFSYDARFGGGVARHGTFSGRLTSESELAGQITYDGQSPVDEVYQKPMGILSPNR